MSDRHPKILGEGKELQLSCGWASIWSGRWRWREGQPFSSEDSTGNMESGEPAPASSHSGSQALEETQVSVKLEIEEVIRNLFACMEGRVITVERWPRVTNTPLDDSLTQTQYFSECESPLSAGARGIFNVTMTSTCYKRWTESLPMQAKVWA